MIYEGKEDIMIDRDLKIIKLRKEEKLSYRKIAERVGCSHGTVGNVLNKYNVLNVAPLELDFLGDKPDIVHALEHNIPFYLIVEERDRTRKHIRTVNIDKRREFLFRFIFGKKYKMGPNFLRFVNFSILGFSQVRKEIIRDFYLKGTTVSTTDNINTDYRRVYRVQARQELKELISKTPVSNLIVRGVIEK